MSSQLIIVEDEKIIRDGITEYDWSRIHVEVAATFFNGMAALRYMENNPVEIVLTDIRMPGMGGLEFVDMIRKRYPQVIVVCISGHDDYEYLRECLRLGVKDYLLKPIDENELLEVIAHFIEEKKSNESNEREFQDIQNYAIKQALSYISDNFHHPISLDDVARKACLNATYFSRLFKKELGKNFSEYIVDLRINKAAELLKTTLMSLETISIKCGFTNLRYFSDSFKKKKGMTPSEYRNKKIDAKQN